MHEKEQKRRIGEGPYARQVQFFLGVQLLLTLTTPLRIAHSEIKNYWKEGRFPGVSSKSAYEEA